MNAIDRLLADVTARRGVWWVSQPERDGTITISRGLNKDTRQDVRIVLDRARRVVCYSVWENRRVSIDCDNGRRQRLENHLSAPVRQ